MDNTFSGVWPSDAPPTLWNYHLLKAEEVPRLPVMGFRVEQGFALAFAFGVIFIGVFAWRRFKERSFDTKSFDYRVIKDLEPTELRGPSAMRRAYMIYVGVLLGIYVAMTFFGKLILQTAGSLPIAGTQVDMSSLNFSSPQWPLLLAFGFAGFAPMLKPLEIAETWLRQRAHRAVGIPVKIRQTTQKLIAHLPHPATAAARSAVPAWMTAHLGNRDSIERILTVRDNLALLWRWTKVGRDLWPGAKVPDRLRDLEREVAAEAESVLQEFDEILKQKYYVVPGADGAGRPRSDKKAADNQRLHQKRLELRLDAIVTRMDELRNELASILAVYADRDPDYSTIPDDGPRRLLEKALAPSAVRSGPEFGVLLCLLPVFAVYALGCAFRVHPLLYQVDRVPLTVLATAGLETLRLAILLLLPAVAAFGLRHYLSDRGEWASVARDGAGLVVQQRLAAVFVGWLLTTGGLVLLALLWAALISINGVRFQELLFGGPAPFMLFFPSQSGLAVPFLLVTLMAADSVPTRAGALRLLLGLLSAACVAACVAVHLYLWWGGDACTPGRPFLSDLFEPGCFKLYGGLDFVLYPVVAFLAATVFGARSGAPRESGAARSMASHRPAPALAALAVGVGLAAGGAQAQPMQPAETPVYLGFRADAEPFSYRIEVDGKDRFIGYMADLCYRIFSGSPYQVVPVEVTAADRFARIRQPGHDQGGGAVDVLCDPATVRFSDPDARARAGIFSPIVFTSGVSYLYRRSRIVGKPIYIGYLVGSTARPVVKQACEIDLLRVRRPGAPPKCALPDDHGLLEGLADGKDLPPCPQTDGALPEGASDYNFCVMKSHGDLVKWFCGRPKEADKEPPFQLAYFGDRELMLGKLESWRAQGHDCPDQEIERGPGNLTYEPYALIVTKANPELVQYVQRRIFEFFSHAAEAKSLFTTWFPGQQMSAPLAYLFLLNAVAEERMFLRPDLGDLDGPAPAAAGAAAAATR